jgi:hypothetical protein
MPYEATSLGTDIKSYVSFAFNLRARPEMNRFISATYPVIPAQAGIQGAEVLSLALDPRFRGGDD